MDLKFIKKSIEFLLHDKKTLTLNDKKQSIIHIFNHNYIVDGKIFIEEPIKCLCRLHKSRDDSYYPCQKNNLKTLIKHLLTAILKSKD